MKEWIILTLSRILLCFYEIYPEHITTPADIQDGSPLSHGSPSTSSQPPTLQAVHQPLVSSSQTMVCAEYPQQVFPQPPPYANNYAYPSMAPSGHYMVTRTYSNPTTLPTAPSNYPQVCILFTGSPLFFLLRSLRSHNRSQTNLLHIRVLNNFSILAIGGITMFKECGKQGILRRVIVIDRSKL